MTTNLKEVFCFVVNRDKDLMTIDFDDDVSLAEKEVIVLSIALRRDRYIVNRGEGLMAVDFDDHVSLTEKEGACMAGRGGPTQGMRNRKDGALALVRKQMAGEEEGAAVRRPIVNDCGRGERVRVVVMKADCERWGSSVGSNCSNGRAEAAGPSGKDKGGNNSKMRQLDEIEDENDG
ncbi:hypothetical protein BHE74_00031709 [Ensete ventricosum]|nr:hypothetical protein BHE74_00031709 [Ensete ventricosum]